MLSTAKAAPPRRRLSPWGSRGTSGAAEAYHSALAVAPGDSLAAELLDSALRDEADEASEWLDGA